jgi:Zn-dependent M28 family amino/carboxypeptidase
MKNQKLVTITLIVILLIINNANGDLEECKMFKTEMPGESYEGKVTLLTDNEKQLSHNLFKHVEALSVNRGERNIVNYKNLKSAAEYIEDQLQNFGYSINRQVYFVQGKEVYNIEVEKKGEAVLEDIIIIGAHYDSALGTPGANDNATGVAALLEIARYLRDKTLKHTIRLIAFVNEEPPYFYTDKMGSYIYAKTLTANNIKLAGMISLEMLGFYSEEPSSQTYPSPLNIYYPNKANFIGFVSNKRSESFLLNLIRLFRDNAKIPSEGLIAPETFPGVSLSDHLPFWQAGYPAIMITDTAFFRYKHYHQPSDTIDKIDFAYLSKVVEGLKKMIIHAF